MKLNEDHDIFSHGAQASNEPREVGKYVLPFERMTQNLLRRISDAIEVAPEYILRRRRSDFQARSVKRIAG